MALAGSGSRSSTTSSAGLAGGKGPAALAVSTSPAEAAAGRVARRRRRACSKTVARVAGRATGNVSNVVDLDAYDDPDDPPPGYRAMPCPSCAVDYLKPKS